MHRPAGRVALAAMLGLWTCSAWLLNRPGHLSVDSLIQIAEGRSGVFESYNPLFISVVFGRLTALTGGTVSLVLIATISLALAAWLLLMRIERPGALGVAATGALLFMPILLIYPGIVWKDVWFAHAAVLGFALITLRGRWHAFLVESLSLALFAFAMLSRQTGILVAGVGVLVLALSAPPPRGPRFPRARAAVGILARFAVLFALALGFSLAAKSTAREITGQPVASGVRLIAVFDIAGMLQRLPQARLDRFARMGVDTSTFEAAARRNFSAERIDTLNFPPIRGLGRLAVTDVLLQWFDMVAAHPGTYLAHRGEVYAWLLGLRGQERCLPVHVGYASDTLATKAGIDAPASPNASLLYGYARIFVGSPYFSPLTWGVVSSLVLLYLRRRGLCRTPIAGLQWAGLLYLASYFPVALSCDFRYTYFSTVAASLGLMFVFLSGVQPAAGGRGQRTVVTDRSAR